jgi:hypothetical protein
MQQLPSLFSLRQPRQAQAASTIKDALSRRNRLDSFALTLTGRSSVTALLSGLGRKANVQLELRTSSGDLVSIARKQGKTKRVLDLGDVAAGTYYLQAVLKRGQATRYRLNIATTPIAPPIPPDYAGQTPGTARAIALSSTPALFGDYVGPEDTQDYYTFTVGEAGSPSAKFNLTCRGTELPTPALSPCEIA